MSDPNDRKPISNEKLRTPSPHSRASSDTLNRAISEFEKRFGNWIMTFNQVYGRDLSQPAIWAYYETLKDLTPEELDRGCIDAMKRIKFCPNPAEILESVEATRPAIVLNSKQLPEPSFTDDEAKQFLAELREIVFPDREVAKAVLEITDEMRENYERKKQEALKRFGGGAA